MQVVTVGDHAGHQIGPGEGDADRAGLAGEQRGHRVAEVGESGCSRGHGGRHLGGGGGGVAKAHDDAAGGEVGDDLEGAGQLGGERRQQHAVSRDHAATRSSDAAASRWRGCAPARVGAIIGPSKWSPRGTAPVHPAGGPAASAASAARRVAASLVMTVGAKAVTP